jgi:hypothetical protein
MSPAAPRVGKTAAATTWSPREPYADLSATFRSDTEAFDAWFGEGGGSRISELDNTAEATFRSQHQHQQQQQQQHQQHQQQQQHHTARSGSYSRPDSPRSGSSSEYSYGSIDDAPSPATRLSKYNRGPPRSDRHGASSSSSSASSADPSYTYSSEYSYSYESVSTDGGGDPPHAIDYRHGEDGASPATGDRLRDSVLSTQRLIRERVRRARGLSTEPVTVHGRSGARADAAVDRVVAMRIGVHAGSPDSQSGSPTRPRASQPWNDPRNLSAVTDDAENDSRDSRDSSSYNARNPRRNRHRTDDPRSSPTADDTLLANLSLEDAAHPLTPRDREVIATWARIRAERDGADMARARAREVRFRLDP